MNDLREYNDLNNRNSKMDVLQVAIQIFKLTVLFIVSIQCLTATSATAPIYSPRGTCTSPDDVYQIKWISKTVDPGESLQVYCKRHDETRVPMESVSSRLREVESERFVLETTLTVHSLSDGLFSSCECAVVKNGTAVGAVQNISKANIWLRNDTMFTMSQDEILISPGQEEFEVTFDVACDFGGSFEVHYNNRLLEHRHSPGPDRLPYIELLRAVLRFPDPSCRDIGLYRIIYRASRNYRPIETARDLWIRANDSSSCPTEIAFQENSTTVDDIKAKLGLQANEAPVSPKPENCPGNTGVITGLIILALVILIVFAAYGVYRFYKNHQLQKSQRETNGGAERMALNGDVKGNVQVDVENNG